MFAVRSQRWELRGKRGGRGEGGARGGARANQEVGEFKDSDDDMFALRRQRWELRGERGEGREVQRGGKEF